MALVSSAFEKLLPADWLERFDQAADVVYGLDEELRIRYVNPAWVAFAHENGGDASLVPPDVIGSAFLDAIPGLITPFYAWNLREVRRSGRPWEHLFECSSPELFRTFHMRVSGLGEGRGLLVRNHLLIERSHETAVRPPCPSLPSRYVGNDGVVRQCSHCRRVRRRGRVDAWDWVPDFVRRPHPTTSHSLCNGCFRHYFPARGPSATGGSPDVAGA